MVGCPPGTGRAGFPFGLWRANCNSPSPGLYIRVLLDLEACGLHVYCVPVSGTGGAREGERTDKAHNLVIPERHRPWTGLADSLDNSGQAGMAAHVSAAQVTGRGYDMVEGALCPMLRERLKTGAFKPQQATAGSRSCMSSSCRWAARPTATPCSMFAEPSKRYTRGLCWQLAAAAAVR